MSTNGAVGAWAVDRDDAVHWLNWQREGSLDLVITDPPYESLERHRATGTTTRLKVSKASSNRWFQIFPNDKFPVLFAALYRAMSRDSHLYVFVDHVTMPIAVDAAVCAGFRYWKPLVWDKMRIGMGYHYRARYEFILFLEKGKRKLNDFGVADVIQAPRIARGYPTEKPVSVSEVLIRQSSRIGELVADPFVGSGSTGVAAVKLGRDFIGCDIEPTAVDIARGRLNAASHAAPTARVSNG